MATSSMPDNPYSSPSQPSNALNVRTGIKLWKSRLFFFALSFIAAWITFYTACSINVFSTPYLEQHMGVALFAAWIMESVVVSTIVCGVLAVSLFFGDIKPGHYVALILLCSLEFGLMFVFFVAFFGV